MILNPEKDLQIACDEWLEARALFMSGSGTRSFEDFSAASEKLFAAFVRDFRSEDFAVLNRAFRSFRGCLVQASKSPGAYPAWRPERNLRNRN